MNIELHERLMRVTVDTFKRETDKLKAELERESVMAKEWRKAFLASDEWRSSLSVEFNNMCFVLAGAGYELTSTGEWRPPLGKRPDVEGQNLIAAAMAHVDAERNLFDAANKYKARPK